MAATLAGTITHKVQLSYANPDAANLAAPVMDLVKLIEKTLSSGTGTDEVNRLYVAEVEVSGAGSVTLDLAGSLTDVFGQTITLAKLKYLLIANMAADGTANAADEVITVGNATNPVPVFGTGSHVVVLPVNALLSLYLPAGATVTGGSADELKLANAGAGSAKVVVILAGSTS